MIMHSTLKWRDQQDGHNHTKGIAPICPYSAHNMRLRELFYRLRFCRAGNESVESRYVVPPFSVKVSESRTGQDACVLKLAPGLMSKWQGKLIHG
jgi:hypothetical protein